MRLERLILGVLGAVTLVACGAQAPPEGTETPATATPTSAPPSPLIIALIAPPALAEAEGVGIGGPLNAQWAIENVALAGGVAGRSLELEELARSEDLLAQATSIAYDDRYVAAIAPEGSEDLAAIADVFLAAGKPLVSATSASADLLRAYGGKDYIWRTRESDVAQVEVLIHYARSEKMKRVGLVTSLDAATTTFFSWFGFFAVEQGYASDAVGISTFDDETDCAAAVSSALEARPDMLFVAAATADQQRCILAGLPPEGQPRPRIVFADTGLDPYALADVPEVGDLEVLAVAGEAGYGAAWVERYGAEVPVPPHGPSQYDAVLLLAYGLQASGGEGGAALAEAMKSVVDGAAGGPFGWDADGVAFALQALRAGERPSLSGAGGPLTFEPELYMDKASSSLALWEITGGQLTFKAQFDTSDAAFESSQGALVPPSEEQREEAPSSSWEPATEKADAWALVAALSDGWDNYRHQADALRQYQLLKREGMDDDHIVLVLAGDIANSEDNALPGTVRNEPGGEDLNQDVVVDYDLALTGDALVDILTGVATSPGAPVLQTTASSNLYVYVVGHGGGSGVNIHAADTSEGLSDDGISFSPTHLRQALCTLRSEGRLRRALAVIEACFSGVFGDASHGGLEAGCEGQGGAEPVEGALLLTAANAIEVSYAGQYDPELGAWVNDQFSAELALRADEEPGISLFDLYVDVYLNVPGSHTSLFNAAAAGDLSRVSLEEFIAP